MRNTGRTILLLVIAPSLVVGWWVYASQALKPAPAPAADAKPDVPAAVAPAPAPAPKLPESPPPSAPAGSPAAPQGALKRDPTVPQGDLRDAVIAAQLQGGAGEKGAGGLFPVIGLKGRIVGPRGLATAVLSVDGNTVFVTPGDEIEIATPRLGLPSVTLKIDQIDAQQVRGTLVQLNRVVLLN